jgi:hypothetical protein
MRLGSSAETRELKHASVQHFGRLVASARAKYCLREIIEIKKYSRNEEDAIEEL